MLQDGKVIKYQDIDEMILKSRQTVRDLMKIARARETVNHAEDPMMVDQHNQQTTKLFQSIDKALMEHHNQVRQAEEILLDTPGSDGRYNDAQKAKQHSALTAAYGSVAQGQEAMLNNQHRVLRDMVDALLLREQYIVDLNRAYQDTDPKPPFLTDLIRSQEAMIDYTQQLVTDYNESADYLIDELGYKPTNAMQEQIQETKDLASHDFAGALGVGTQYERSDYIEIAAQSASTRPGQGDPAANAGPSAPRQLITPPAHKLHTVTENEITIHKPKAGENYNLRDSKGAIVNTQSEDLNQEQARLLSKQDTIGQLITQTYQQLNQGFIDQIQGNEQLSALGQLVKVNNDSSVVERLHLLDAAGEQQPLPPELKQAYQAYLHEHGQTVANNVFKDSGFTANIKFKAPAPAPQPKAAMSEADQQKAIGDLNELLEHAARRDYEKIDRIESVLRDRKVTEAPAQVRAQIISLRDAAEDKCRTVLQTFFDENPKLAQSDDCRAALTQAMQNFIDLKGQDIQFDRAHDETASFQAHREAARGKIAELDHDSREEQQTSDSEHQTVPRIQ